VFQKLERKRRITFSDLLQPPNVETRDGKFGSLLSPAEGAPGQDGKRSELGSRKPASFSPEEANEVSVRSSFRTSPLADDGHGSDVTRRQK
jgi:hypothetical protein